jgi:protein SCO1/2
MRFTKFLIPAVTVSVLGLGGFTLVHAENSMAMTEIHQGHDMRDMQKGHEGHDHSRHLKAMQDHTYNLSSQDYSPPDVTLLNQAGEKQSLHELLSQDRSVALNFIFTSCTTICPVMTSIFAAMQSKLNEGELKKLQVISISIDPDYDRPEKLLAYSQRFNAGKNWVFLTGNSLDVNNVMRAFGVYEGSKMNHKPVSLLRKASGDSWLRVDGLASGKNLAELVEKNLFNN